MVEEQERVPMNQQLHKAVKHSNYMHHVSLQKQLKIYNRQQRLVAKELNEISKLRETIKEITKLTHRTEKVSGAKKTSGQNQLEEFVNDDQGTNGKDELKKDESFKSLLIKRNGSEVKTKNSDKARAMNVASVLLSKRSKLVKSTSFPEISSNKETSFSEVTRLRSKSELASSSRYSRNFLAGPRSRSQTVLDTHCPGHPASCLPGSPRIRSRTLEGHEGDSGGSRSAKMNENSTKLTEEESTRIKGKFRQIGHSVLAIAFLKGLN